MTQVTQAAFNPDALLDVKLPEHWVTASQTVGMQYFYPFHVPGLPGGSESVCKEEVLKEIDHMLSPEGKVVFQDQLTSNVEPALKKFWSTFMPHLPQTGAVIIYHGLVNNTEVTYVRYEQDHVKPVTFVIASSEFGYFLRGWTEAVKQEHMQIEMEDWCKHPTEYSELKLAKYLFNVSMLPLSLPLNYFYLDSFGINYSHFDNMLAEDFKRIKDVRKELSNRFDRYIADITRFALVLKDKVRFKDHNLMLSFKATEDFKHLNVGLDKIYSKFPEGGQFECGLQPLRLEDWDKEGDNVKVIVRRILAVVAKTNKMLDALPGKLPDNQWCHDTLTVMVKERLMASSHFLKELYQANPTDIRPYVEETANKVLSALNERGGNIGLDLTSWVVYQYFDDGSAPVPIVTEGLNFKQELYNLHTERFMEVLYQYMFHLRSPYVRPYVNKTIIKKDDGIPVGSIRPLEQK